MKAEIERVSLFDAAITHQQRFVIRSQSYPASENVGELGKIIEAYNWLQNAIFDSHANHRPRAVPVFSRVDIQAVVRPLVVADLLRPHFGFLKPTHQDNATILEKH